MQTRWFPRAAAFASLVLAGGLIGCGSSDGPPSATPRATPAVAGTPTGQGPWLNDLRIASSTDGRTFDSATLFQKSSGVPSLARLPDGRLLAAFQWFPDLSSPAWDRVAVKQSSDNGRTWSEPQAILVNGLPSSYTRPFDPTLVVLPDGRIRVYFTSNPEGQTQTASDKNGFYSAISTDGVSYTWEPGTRFWPGKSVVDCAAIYFDGRVHLMAPVMGSAAAYHTASRDGLDLVRLDDVPSLEGENWTGNLLSFPGGLRFYGTSSMGGRGMWYRESADGGAWTSPRYLGINGGDPAVVQASDGRYWIVFVS